MKDYQLYGIEPGQVYVPADGSIHYLTVHDVESYADCADVVVLDRCAGAGRRIDAFKLARVRYVLVHPSNDEMTWLLKTLKSGKADIFQQRHAAQLVQVLHQMLEDQAVHAQRGRFVVDHGESHRSENERDGQRTWLCARVADDASLSCQAARADALDAAIRQLSERGDATQDTST